MRVVYRRTVDKTRVLPPYVSGDESNEAPNPITLRPDSYKTHGGYAIILVKIRCR